MRLDFGEQVEEYFVPASSISTLSAHITKTKRGIYRGWYGGCGIGGNSKSLDKTRKYVRDYVLDRIEGKIREHQDALFTLYRSQDLLVNTTDLTTCFLAGS